MIDKRWNEVFARLDAINDQLATLNAAAKNKPVKAAPTKAQLMKIKGVGDATADEILKLIS